MYPDFLASPELALACLRQENRIRHREADQRRLALHATASRPVGWPTVIGAVRAILNRSYWRLKLKPELGSMTASSH